MEIIETATHKTFQCFNSKQLSGIKKDVRVRIWSVTDKKMKKQLSHTDIQAISNQQSLAVEVCLFRVRRKYVWAELIKINLTLIISCQGNSRVYEVRYCSFACRETITWKRRGYKLSLIFLIATMVCCLWPARKQWRHSIEPKWKFPFVNEVNQVWAFLMTPVTWTIESWH